MKRSTKVIIVTAALALILLGTAMYAIFALKPHAEAPTSSQTVTPPTRTELLSLVNQERAKAGVAPLIENASLDQSAQFKSDDQVRRNYFGHQDPKTHKNNGIDYAFSITGDECKTISENLAWEPDGTLETASNAVAWWMSSTPHRTAMLNPIYKLTGFGIDKDVVTEHFCQQ